MPTAGPRLLGPAEVRRLAAELDLRPTKQRGQNFVIDANTVRRIVREAGVGPDDVVVEVGPGLGSLTLALLEVGARVVAIEIDERLAARLPATVAEHAPDAADRLHVVAADALRVTELPGPPPTTLVANLPYNVSVPVLLHLLTLLPSLERGLVLVQAEVADRLAAGPGSKVYGIPSVKAAWFADVRRAGAVGRHVFWPEPNVDSGLVAWERREPAGHHRDPGTGLRGRRRGVRPPTQGTARRAARAGRLRRVRRGGAGRGRHRPPRTRRGAHRRGLHPDRRGAAGGPRMNLSIQPEEQRSVTVRAPAKINLHLGVGRPRADGFHPLDTVFQAVGLYDDVRATDGDGTVTVEAAEYLPQGVLADLASQDDNIVTHAARLLAATATDGTELPLADLLVEKRIPVAGGMAGGSADGAAALVALDRLWALDTSDETLLDLAATLGSDVPFSMLGGTAHGSGRGELLHVIPDATTWWWVVVPSSEGLSTPSVYRRFDEMFPDAPATPASSAGTLAALSSGDPDRLAAALHNDLEAPALDLRPALGDLIAHGEAEGALRGMVSGSGPTVVFLCWSGDHARSLADTLQGDDLPVVLVANGPVAGAHVL